MAIGTDVPDISMQGRGPANNSPRANRATTASGTTEAEIFKRNMTRYPLDTNPRQPAYGWQRVNGSSYCGVDGGKAALAEMHEALRRKEGRRTPRMRGIQYAAAYRFHHCCLWNAGRPVPSTPRLRRGFRSWLAVALVEAASRAMTTG